MPSTVTEANDYAQQLVDAGLKVSESAQAAALTVVRKAVESVESVAPQAQELVSKVDAGEVRRLIESAFTTAERVLGQQKRYVSELITSVLAPAPAAGAAPTTPTTTTTTKAS